MPNWTNITIRCKGIEKLPIFSLDTNGKKKFDYNTIAPCPECVVNTISPMRDEALFHYLFKRFGNERAREILLSMPRSWDEEFLKKSAEEIISLTDKEEALGFGPGAKTISAYELGKNYYDSYRESGCFDWYDWTYQHWGVKWNASDSYVEEDVIFFDAPWGYPDRIFEKMAEMFPEKEFHVEMEFEDEPETIYTIDFDSKNWKEGSYPNEDYEGEVE